MYTQFLYLIHPPNPLSLPPPLSHWYHTPTLSRTCSTFLFSDFVEEKRKKNNILLVYDKGGYTESFLVIFPCIYVL
jgi:hypothetical protein